MNTARREQWKRAFTFQANETSMVGSLLVATCLGCFSFLWPGHTILVFAISSLAYSIVVDFVFVRPENRRLLKVLLWNVLAIVIFASFVRFSAR